MKRKWIADLIFIGFVVLLSLLYFFTLSLVPFHPDESTQIFMSADFERFLEAPANLYWTKNPADAARQRYRELDAPLSRTLIGLGRFVLDLPALKNDWNWSKTWSDNADAGALPDQDFLTCARAFVAFVFPFSLILLYETGKHISGRSAGWITAFLFFGNPHILLHSRRAMAESILLFFIILSIFALLKWNKNTWLAAIPVSLAFNAKQTAAGLVLAGIIILILHHRREGLRKTVTQVFLFLLLFTAITFFLNPFLWSNPVDALRSAVESRRSLVEEQTSTFILYKDAAVLDNMPKKMLSLFAQVFFGPVQFAESGNYIDTLAGQISAYQTHWMNRVFVHQGWHFLVLLFSTAGIIRSVALSRDPSNSGQAHRKINIIFGITFLSLLLLIPLSFQRYYLPVVPFLCIYAALMLTEMGMLLFRKLTQGDASPAHAGGDAG